MTNPDTSGHTGTIQQFYEALLKSETYSAKNLTLFQDNVLKDLLPFVAKHVPFYRGRLSPVFPQRRQLQSGELGQTPNSDSRRTAQQP